MIITPNQISKATGFRVNWISSRFMHLAKDYVVNNESQYDVDELLSYCQSYSSNTINSKQKLKSESMIKTLIKYLEGLKMTTIVTNRQDFTKVCIKIMSDTSMSNNVKDKFIHLLTLAFETGVEVGTKGKCEVMI